VSDARIRGIHVSARQPPHPFAPFPSSPYPPAASHPHPRFTLPSSNSRRASTVKGGLRASFLDEDVALQPSSSKTPVAPSVKKRPASAADFTTPLGGSGSGGGTANKKQHTGGVDGDAAAATPDAPTPARLTVADYADPLATKGASFAARDKKGAVMHTLNDHLKDKQEAERKAEEDEAMAAAGAGGEDEGAAAGGEARTARVRYLSQWHRGLDVDAT
jgi:hypothetical protein